MNARKAKRLRKEAQELTVGEPNVEYQHGQTPSYAPVFIPGTTTISGYRKTRPGTPTVMSANCTRAVYQQLKRAATQPPSEF